MTALWIFLLYCIRALSSIHEETGLPVIIKLLMVQLSAIDDVIKGHDTSHEIQDNRRHHQRTLHDLRQLLTQAAKVHRSAFEFCSKYIYTVAPFTTGVRSHVRSVRPEISGIITWSPDQGVAAQRTLGTWPGLSGRTLWYVEKL